MTNETTELVHTRDRSAIADMFNRIAPTYDRMNRLMTLGQDIRWRKIAVEESGAGPGDQVLDVATGTGDVARMLAKRVIPEGSVVGIDIASDMLAIAARNSRGLSITYRQVDVEELSEESVYDAAVVAFGFRNFADREAGVRTMFRALKPGGRMVILELVPASGAMRPIVEFYEHRLIPAIGAIVSRDPQAYEYLPRSVARSATIEEIVTLLQSIGCVEVRSRRLNFGTLAVVSGMRQASPL